MDSLTSPTLRGANTGSSIAPHSFLPLEAPLTMPVQSLWGRRQRAPAPQTWRLVFAFRRFFVVGATAAMTCVAAYEMYLVLSVSALTLPESGLLGLFVLLFAWIAFSLVSGIGGFFSLLTGRANDLRIPTECPLPNLRSSNALLIPTYNEEPGRVFARLRAMYESLQQTGRLEHFEFFILSDTTNPDMWIEEEETFLALRRRLATERVYYRHRGNNTERKAGNIAEWVKRFGGRYEHMIVLDADSLMTGDTIVRLAGAMERLPTVGLIQTFPTVVNGLTLFARLQQFAGRVYGPMIAAGIAWWHGSESNYWGHNAIIRVAAFAEHAGLPTMRGRSPFGGHILSHDFVEAALMRRAGWAIHMVPELGGSFEEAPPSLTDYALRDRRWCQGNMQHLAVLPARGLHWVSRLHLLTGIGSYLTAPLWLLFLLLGILISLQAYFVRPEYFPKGFSLFPTWPAQDPVLAAWVFAATMGLLIVPKLLAYLVLLTRRAERQAFGGGFRVLLAVVAESLLAALIAPSMMIFQSTAVAEILLGRDAGWQVQRRSDGRITRDEVYRKFTVPTLCGLAMAASAYAVSLPLLLWMSPVIIGLVCAIPIGLVTSTAPRVARLFATPEDNRAPALLQRARELASQARIEPHGAALTELRQNPALLGPHMQSLETPPRKSGRIDIDLAIARAKIEQSDDFEEAVSSLSARETLAVLKHRHALEQVMRMPRATASAEV